MTRVCVFVDGENLRHNICDLFSPDYFDKRDYLPENARWGDFFDKLVAQATDGEGKRVRTYWYAIDLVDPYPFVLKRERQNDVAFDEWVARNERVLKSSGKWAATAGPDKYRNLAAIHDAMWAERERIKHRFEGFHVIQNRIAQINRAVEFRRSGGISYNLLTRELGSEKTVDANLSIDVVLLKDNYDTALIVSGDQDYVPAVQAAKNFGRHAVNVAFLDKNGSLLPGGAKRLNERTDWSIAVSFDEFREMLGLSEAIAT